MMRHWTFGRRIAAIATALVTLTVAVGIVAIVALRSAVSSKDDVIDDASGTLVAANQLVADRWELSGALRAYLLTGDQQYLDERATVLQHFDGIIAELRTRDRSPEAQQQLDAIAAAEANQDSIVGPLVELKQSGASAAAVEQAFRDARANGQATTAPTSLGEAVTAYVASQTARIDADREDASDSASTAQWLVVGIALIAAVLGTVIAAQVARKLRRQIGTSVGEVQSSSAELQASANQQAVGASEQATAMSEITTTINELLATSRQIAESAQRVVQIAEETAQLGGRGEETVAHGLGSMAEIRQHVDLVVTHMLDLGQKSQQIGAVLEILTELAEQTNILAINATIEAAGAGDHGSRFAVVADEIRKLADRVAGSTKEVRDLIDDVRRAVNTTVMATETGSKAVDAGAAHVTQVAASFRHIASAANTTTEAAREIELSTKQQTTAVEQVNVAIANVAQATRESEASSSQTLQTAAQLSSLSVELRRLVEAGARA
jgi:methyl-accepting chemotaxis protein